MAERLGGTEGISQATEAFRASMDAETPGRSIKRSARKTAAEEENRQDIEEVFPNRRLDRSEPEGGADDVPEPVQRARAERQAGNADFGQVEDDEAPPLDPNEGTEEESEEEPDEEEEAPEDEEEEAEAHPEGFDPNQMVRVVVDGQPVEVSMGEMANGYIRTETFHRRMSELGEGVKAFHAQKMEFDGTLAYHVQRAEALEAMVQSFMPHEPDWDAQFHTNPTEASYLKYQWDEIQKKLHGVMQSKAEAQAQRDALLSERLNQFIHANKHRVASWHPEWRSEKQWRRDNDSMRRTAMSVGYTENDLAQLYDARGMEILLKASRYDRMMAAKPKPVRQHVTPTRNNGATPSRNVSRSFDRAEKRLSRSGSIKDAEAVFQGILDRER